MDPPLGAAGRDYVLVAIKVGGAAAGQADKKINR